jgi:hypothetical protein
MSRRGWDMEVSRVGVRVGEMDECIEGVKVVAILSCRLDGTLLFFGRSVGICTVGLVCRGVDRERRLTVHMLLEARSTGC